MDFNILQYFEIALTLGIVVLFGYFVLKTSKYYFENVETSESNLLTSKAPTDPVTHDLYRAIATLREAVEKSPELYLASLLQPYLFSDTWDLIETSQTGSTDLAKVQYEAIGISMKALHLLKNEQVEAALQEAETALLLAPHQTMALSAKIVCLIKLERFQQALEHTGLLPAKEEGQAGLFALQGIIHLGLRQEAEALACFKQAYDLDCNRLDYRLHALACLKSMKQFEEWGKEIERLKLIASNNLYILAECADYLITTKQLELAQQVVAKLVHDHPRFAKSWLMAGRIHDATSEYSQALECYHKAKTLDSHCEAAHLLAIVYHRLHRWSESLEWGRASVKQSPSNQGSLANLSHYLLCTGQIVEAQQIVLDLLKNQPDNPHALEEQGWIYYVQGRQAEANAIWKQAGEIKPDVHDWHDAELVVIQQLIQEGVFSTGQR